VRLDPEQELSAVDLDELGRDLNHSPTGVARRWRTQIS